MVSDLLGDVGRRCPRGEHQVVLGIPGRELQEVLPGSLVEDVAGGLEPVLLRASRQTASAGSTSSSTVSCGRRSSVAHRATRSTSAAASTRPAPW